MELAETLLEDEANEWWKRIKERLSNKERKHSVVFQEMFRKEFFFNTLLYNERKETKTSCKTTITKEEYRKFLLKATTMEFYSINWIIFNS